MYVPLRDLQDSRKSDALELVRTTPTLIRQIYIDIYYLTSRASEVYLSLVQHNTTQQTQQTQQTSWQTLSFDLSSRSMVNIQDPAFV